MMKWRIREKERGRERYSSVITLIKNIEMDVTRRYGRETDRGS